VLEIKSLFPFGGLFFYLLVMNEAFVIELTEFSFVESVHQLLPKALHHKILVLKLGRSTPMKVPSSLRSSLLVLVDQRTGSSDLVRLYPFQ